MRLRCMKFKRKRHSDNYKLRNRTFIKLGLLSLEQFCLPAAAKACALTPRAGQSLGGRPVTATVTPVNMGN